ncbi:nitrate/sulfonate/bicarbonate ABC transporter periplasmic protein [Klebsiella pneumoniae]|uniref:Nitrate/sulfonate/bicarbonate ABC transporter periplasmic protein n=1 Tax=Klebsiella pneumoniae TaxID=573 RepID=A0A377TZE7_KLEPN|nr:nitrate/sulfonate/bicarbonate ABC transporter periplasmic protein [Klebsiella pneumoniae]
MRIARLKKAAMRSQLEAANALQNLPYDIKWAEFPAAARWRKPSTRAPWTRGSSAMRRCSSPWPTVRRSKLLPWIKATGGDRGAGITRQHVKKRR